MAVDRDTVARQVIHMDRTGHRVAKVNSPVESQKIVVPRKDMRCQAMPTEISVPPETEVTALCEERRAIRERDDRECLLSLQVDGGAVEEDRHRGGRAWSAEQGICRHL